MKILVIGGTGLIGSQVVTKLKNQGHEVIAASPSSGVNTLTGEGLSEAMEGTDVVVDVANSPSFDELPVMHFFGTSAINIAVAERKHNVKHHVALSVVGTHLMQSSPYFRAKLVQEAIIKASGIPYTILRATQFFEFLDAVAQFSKTSDGGIHVTTALMQPMASADVAAFVAEAAAGAPANDRIEIAGPDKLPMHEVIRRYLRTKNDNTNVIAEEGADYYGTPVQESTLVPQGPAKIGAITLEEWAKAKAAAAAKA